MGEVGIVVAILGGLLAAIAGVASSDWAAVGVGVGIIGLALILGDSLPLSWTVTLPASRPSREQPDSRGDDDRS